MRFIDLIVEDLTANGMMEARRLFQPPFTDDVPQGPLAIFGEDDVAQIVDILNTVRANAAPESTVA